MVVVKRLLGQVRKAVDEYNMINEGDRIAIGVSGGKDSLSLLYALGHLKSFYPKKFELEAITLTLGLGEVNLAPVKQLCRTLNINYTIEDTLIGKIVFEARHEKNPCSMCANMRRGALNNTAKRLNCNKVALGHNKDDVIETLLMNLFYEGRMCTFETVTYLERQKLYVIRPLIYLEEREIKGFIKSCGLETIESPCKIDGKTKRQQMKELILDLSHQNRHIRGNIFGAIKRFRLDK